MVERTQVAIIGGGPAGLLLSHILALNGIDSVVLERQSRAHVLRRIRAGVLEAGTVQLLRDVGLGGRMDREGHVHDGVAIAWEGKPRFLIDTRKHTGKPMMAYGQTAITEDLYAARDAAGGRIIDEAENVQLHEIASDRSFVTFERNGTRRRIEGTFQPGERVVVIDDIVTDGASKLEAIEPLEAAGLVVEDLVVLIDREQGARERLAAKGYRLHAVLTISACFDALETAGLVDRARLAEARAFVRAARGA